VSSQQSPFPDSESAREGQEAAHQQTPLPARGRPGEGAPQADLTPTFVLPLEGGGVGLSTPTLGDRIESPEEVPPTPVGWFPSARLAAAVAGGALLVALGAAWWPLIYLGALWWVAIAAAAAADVGALQAWRRVAGWRSIEDVISLGAANRVTLGLRNRSATSFRCRLRDEPPLDFLVEPGRAACDLPPGGECSDAYHVTPPRRGDFPFGILNLRLTAGFGLIVRQVSFDLRRSVKVYPNLAGIRAHEIAARRERLADIGIHPARLKGTGLEFESLRAYVPGDELRRVDWKATARHAELITREFDVERSQHIILCLDLGRTMASDLGVMTKADHAVNAATLLAYVAAKGGDWVGLYAFAQEPVIYVAPRKQQFSRILDSLYALQPQNTESNYYRSFMGAAQRIRKRALVVLFTDLPDPDSSARLLRYVTLLTRRHLVLCAALSDYELYDIAARTPSQPRELYERTVATSLLADRQRALSELRKRGAIAFDATPANLSVEVLNRYLEIKARAQL